MRTLFFYGTLCHVPLLEAVLGVQTGALALRVAPAQLADHQSYWVKDQPYPTIVKEVGSVARGLIFKDVTEDEEQCLTYYEGGFSYDLRSISVRAGSQSLSAKSYFPNDTDQVLGAPWQLADWVQRWGVMAVGAATDVMARRATLGADEAAGLRPFLMARHWSKDIAGRQPHPAQIRRAAQPGDVAITERHAGYRGFFELAEFEFDHIRFDGSSAPRLKREAFVAFDAALVLPYDPVNDLVLLIEQLRFGPLWRDDPNPWVFEPIAGLVDAGEDPAETARREAIEEAGLELGPLELMTRVYASPGYSTEYFHCFLAQSDLSGYEMRTAGLLSENEDIRSHLLPFEQVMALVRTGEINTGPLVMMLYWLAAERPRLRAAT